MWIKQKNLEIEIVDKNLEIVDVGITKIPKYEIVDKIKKNKKTKLV